MLVALVYYLLAVGAGAYPSGKVNSMAIPPNADGASIKHSTSFSSFSFEPAFWHEFIGNKSQPNELTLGLIRELRRHGSRPHIRPGGITMDSMGFDPRGGDPMRITNSKGGVYRTDVGPAYYESWDNFPEDTKFTSTLNFGNDSLTIAKDLALASVKYQPNKVDFFELGNEPNNYNSSRWKGSTKAYVAQWKNWTAEIDVAVNKESKQQLPTARWWASSSTTDKTVLNVRPIDVIPAGINTRGQVAQYSIHSYAFATCDPARTALATIPNILNHTGLTNYADKEIMPSARAAIAAGTPWIIGEFNSIACSGNPGVSDTFAQALWTIDTQLLYSVRNASAVYLHQGATLTFQSSNQANKPPADGSPLFSSYSFTYPRNSTGRGAARVLPGFGGLLFLAEAFATPQTQVRSLLPPKGVSSDGFSAYGFYVNNRLRRVAILNMVPYTNTSSHDSTIKIRTGLKNGSVKRLTAPYVTEQDASKVTWAGQAYHKIKPSGHEELECLGAAGEIKIRGSEAVLISLNT